MTPVNEDLGTEVPQKRAYVANAAVLERLDALEASLSEALEFIRDIVAASICPDFKASEFGAMLMSRRAYHDEVKKKTLAYIVKRDAELQAPPTGQ